MLRKVLQHHRQFAETQVRKADWQLMEMVSELKERAQTVETKIEDDSSTASPSSGRVPPSHAVQDCLAGALRLFEEHLEQVQKGAATWPAKDVTHDQSPASGERLLGATCQAARTARFEAEAAAQGMSSPQRAQMTVAHAAMQGKLQIYIPSMVLSSGADSADNAQLTSVVQHLQETVAGMLSSLDVAEQRVLQVETGGLLRCRQRTEALESELVHSERAAENVHREMTRQRQAMRVLQEKVGKLRGEAQRSREEAIALKQLVAQAEISRARHEEEAGMQRQQVLHAQQTCAEVEDALTQTAQAVARQHALIKSLQAENLALLGDSLQQVDGERDASGKFAEDEQAPGSAQSSPRPAKVARTSPQHKSAACE